MEGEATNLVIKAVVVAVGFVLFGSIAIYFLSGIARQHARLLRTAGGQRVLSGICLYQPDHELQSRVGMEALTAFIKRLETECLPKLPPDFPSPIKIIIGIKPGGLARYWIANDQNMPLETDPVELSSAFKTLPPPQVKGPVAFVLILGSWPREEVKESLIPEDWKRFVQGNGKPLRVPDEIFKFVWPD